MTAKSSVSSLKKPGSTLWIFLAGHSRDGLSSTRKSLRCAASLVPIFYDYSRIPLQSSQLTLIQKAREAYFIEFAEMIRPHLKKTKVYVTGGFRTTSGMVQAVQGTACDGVGIGRPLAAEPYLCKEILEGRVSGAIENLVPLPQNTQASGSQLHQIGKGHPEVSDWSDKGEVQRWIEANEKETERKMEILPKVDSSGYAQLRAEVGFAYVR